MVRVYGPIIWPFPSPTIDSGHDTRVTWIPFFILQAAGHRVRGIDFRSYLPFNNQSWGLLIQGRRIDLPFLLSVAYHVTNQSWLLRRFLTICVLLAPGTHMSVLRRTRMSHVSICRIFESWLLHYHIYLIPQLDLYIYFLPSWAFPRGYVGAIWKVVASEVTVSSWGQTFLCQSRTHMVMRLLGNHDWLI